MPKGLARKWYHSSPVIPFLSIKLNTFYADKSLLAIVEPQQEVSVDIDSDSYDSKIIRIDQIP